MMLVYRVKYTLYQLWKESNLLKTPSSREQLGICQTKIKLTTLPFDKETCLTKRIKPSRRTDPTKITKMGRHLLTILSLRTPPKHQQLIAEPFRKRKSRLLAKDVSIISRLRLSSRSLLMEKVLTTAVNVQLTWRAMDLRWRESFRVDLQDG